MSSCWRCEPRTLGWLSLVAPRHDPHSMSTKNLLIAIVAVIAVIAIGVCVVQGIYTVARV